MPRSVRIDAEEVRRRLAPLVPRPGPQPVHPLRNGRPSSARPGRAALTALLPGRPCSPGLREAGGPPPAPARHPAARHRPEALAARRHKLEIAYVAPRSTMGGVPPRRGRRRARARRYAARSPQAGRVAVHDPAPVPEGGRAASVIARALGGVLGEPLPGAPAARYPPSAWPLAPSTAGSVSTLSSVATLEGGAEPPGPLPQLAAEAGRGDGEAAVGGRPCPAPRLRRVRHRALRPVPLHRRHPRARAHAFPRAVVARALARGERSQPRAQSGRERASRFARRPLRRPPRRRLLAGSSSTAGAIPPGQYAAPLRAEPTSRPHLRGRNGGPRARTGAMSWAR